MASYKITIKKSAEKDIRKLPPDDRERSIQKILSLSKQPRPMGSEKLRGDDVYRIRQGDYRVVYIIDDKGKTVQIIKVGHRREVYRDR